MTSQLCTTVLASKSIGLCCWGAQLSSPAVGSLRSIAGVCVRGTYRTTGGHVPTIPYLHVFRPVCSRAPDGERELRAWQAAICFAGVKLYTDGVWKKRGSLMTNGSGRQWVDLRIDSTRCKVCRRCQARAVCRGKAIRVIDRDEAPFVDPARCWGCLTCIPSCPFDAIVRGDSASK